MFTGLVTAVGTIKQKLDTREGARLVLEHSLGTLTLGESVAVNGVCLTVTQHNSREFAVDVSRETLRVTSLVHAKPGSRVNLERALCVGDRLGGHLVSGHVDGLAKVVRLEPSGEALVVGLRAPAELAIYIAKKGSVTLDGVSLTVNRVASNDFDVTLIPHTRSVTTLAQLAVEQELNLEVDVLARYVHRCLVATGQLAGSAEGDASLQAALRRAGFI